MSAASALVAAPTAPSVSPDDPDLGTVLGAVVHGAWQAVSSSPSLAALSAVALAVLVTRAVRAAIHGGHPRDDVRFFSNADRRVIFERAGQRCERHVALFGRCRETTNLQADHVHPYSRGGWTSISNAQALCARHNREKSARVPWQWQLDRLADRRRTYFPATTDPVVVRRRPREVVVPAGRTAVHGR